MTVVVYFGSYGRKKACFVIAQGPELQRWLAGTPADRMTLALDDKVVTWITELLWNT